MERRQLIAQVGDIAKEGDGQQEADDSRSHTRQLPLAVVPALDAGGCTDFAFAVGFALAPAALPDTVVVDEAVLLGELIQPPQFRHSAVEQVEQAPSRAPKERAGERQAVFDG